MTQGHGSKMREMDLRRELLKNPLYKQATQAPRSVKACSCQCPILTLLFKTLLCTCFPLNHLYYYMSYQGWFFCITEISRHASPPQRNTPYQDGTWQDEMALHFIAMDFQVAKPVFCSCFPLSDEVLWLPRKKRPSSGKWPATDEPQ